MTEVRAEKLLIETGRRLRKLRFALGYESQKSFVLAAGFSPSRWSNYESGSRLIDVSAAIRLRERYGITLDWIYCGDVSGLPVRLADALVRAESQPG